MKFLPLILCVAGFVLALLNLTVIGSYSLVLTHPLFDLIVFPTIGLLLGLVIWLAKLAIIAVGDLALHE